MINDMTERMDLMGDLMESASRMLEKAVSHYKSGNCDRGQLDAAIVIANGTAHSCGEYIKNIRSDYDNQKGGQN